MRSASAAALQYYSAKNLAGWAIAQSAHPSFMPVSFVVPGGLKQGYQTPIYYFIYGQYLKIPDRVYGTATLITAISLNHINGLPAPNI